MKNNFILSLILLAVVAAIFFYYDGEPLEVKSYLDSIQFEVKLVDYEDLALDSESELSLYLNSLVSSFEKAVIEINNKYDYQEYLKTRADKNRLTQGELKGIYHSFEKRRSKVIEALIEEFTLKAEHSIKIVLGEDSEKANKLWSELYDINIKPLKSYFNNLGRSQY